MGDYSTESNSIRDGVIEQFANFGREDSRLPVEVNQKRAILRTRRAAPAPIGNARLLLAIEGISSRSPHP
jgi:hypothetical protein